VSHSFSWDYLKNKSEKMGKSLLFTPIMFLVITSSGCLNNVFTPIACTEDARLCPDGTSVSRIPPDCEFKACPACTPGDIITSSCPDGTNYTSYSCDESGVWHEVNYIRNPCEPVEYEPNVGDECESHDECRTPFEFLVQSNCPFGSACIEGTCNVVCPLTYHDPDPNVSKSYPFECISDDDCNCTARTNSLDCLCLDGSCVSVEARTVDDYYWRFDDIELRQHEVDGYYGCFGCSERTDEPAICIDPVPEMKPAEETPERYCNSDFEVVENGNGS
jgi:hypothetical protein